MHILAWIIFGLIVGTIARLLHPGKTPIGGWIATIGIGIAGALVGGFIGRGIGWYEPDETAGYAVSITTAVALLAIYTAVVRRGERPRPL